MLPPWLMGTMMAFICLSIVFVLLLLREIYRYKRAQGSSPRQALRELFDELFLGLPRI